MGNSAASRRARAAATAGVEVSTSMPASTRDSQARTSSSSWSLRLTTQEPTAPVRRHPRVVAQPRDPDAAGLQRVEEVAPLPSLDGPTVDEEGDEVGAPSRPYSAPSGRSRLNASFARIQLGVPGQAGPGRRRRQGAPVRRQEQVPQVDGLLAPARQRRSATGAGRDVPAGATRRHADRRTVATTPDPPGTSLHRTRSSGSARARRRPHQFRRRWRGPGP